MAEEKYPKAIMPKPTMPPQPPKPVMPPPMPMPPITAPMPPMPPMPLMPYVHMPTMVSPCDLLMMVRPVVKHGCKELPKLGPKHTLTEVAMIAFLMGTGLDYRTALMLVESWEVHETFMRDEI